MKVANFQLQQRYTWPVNGLTFWYIRLGDDDGDFVNDEERDRDRDVELYTLTAGGSGAVCN